jgi:hypothetical protein
MDELSQLADYCRKLGAPANQAEMMARQISKRAGQLAVERKLSREEAMAHLLQLVAQGRAGEAPNEFKVPENRP